MTGTEQVWTLVFRNSLNRLVARLQFSSCKALSLFTAFCYCCFCYRRRCSCCCCYRRRCSCRCCYRRRCSCCCCSCYISEKKNLEYLVNENNRRTNFTNLFCQETLRVSSSSSAHHQEFPTVHSALVYVMRVWWQLSSTTRMELMEPAVPYTHIHDRFKITLPNTDQAQDKISVNHYE